MSALAFVGLLLLLAVMDLLCMVQTLSEARKLGLKFYCEKEEVDPEAVVAGGGADAADDEEEEEEQEGMIEDEE